MATLTKEKLEDNGRLQNWKRGQQDIKDYPTLENDEYYIEWHKKVDRQSKLDGWYRLIDLAFDPLNIQPDTDQELFDLQEVFMSTVLQLMLQTPKGMNLI